MRGFNFLALRRADWVVGFGVLLALVGLAAPIAIRWDAGFSKTAVRLFPVFCSGLLGVLVSLAAIVGGFRNYRASDVVLSFAFVLLAIVLFGLSSMWNGVWSVGDFDGNCSVAYPPLIDRFGFSAIRGIGTVFTVGCLIFCAGTALFALLWRPVSFDRTRYLMLLAGAGFIYVVGRNAAASSEQVGQLMGGIVASQYFGNGIFVVLLLGAGLILGHISSFWMRALFAILVFVFSALSGVFEIVFARGFGGGAAYSLPIFWAAFLTPLVLVGREVPRRLETEERIEEHFTLRKTRPSWLVAVFGVLLLTASVALVRFYDLPTLLTCKSNSWAAARLVRAIGLSGGAKVTGRIKDLKGNQLGIEFAETADRDFFAPFDSVPFQFSTLTLSGVNPEIDFQPLENVSIDEIFLEDSVLSAEQLESNHRRATRLNNGTPTELFFRGVSVGDSGTAHLENSWIFRQVEPGQLAGFLRCLSDVDDSRLLGRISIQSGEMNLEDWREIVRLSNAYSFELSSIDIPQGASREISENHSLANITYRNFFEGEDVDSDIDQMVAFAEQSKMQISVGFCNGEYDNDLPNRGRQFCFYKLNASQLERLVALVDPKRFLISSSPYFNQCEISADFWEKIQTFDPFLSSISFEECQFDSEIARAWLPDTQAPTPLSTIRWIDRPLMADGSVDEETMFALALLLDASVSVEPECYDYLNEVLPASKSEAQRHLEICAHLFWIFGRCTERELNGRSPHQSLKATWLSRLEELREQPGEMSEKLFKELERLGFAWRDPKSDQSVVWIPYPFLEIVDCVRLLPQVEVVVIDDLRVPNALGGYDFPNLEELYLPFATTIGEWTLPKSAKNLKRLSLNEEWLKSGSLMDFPSLEKLEIYGEPSRKLLTELRQLQSLKELTIYISGSAARFGRIPLRGPNLPGVKVNVVPYQNSGQRYQAFQVKRMKKLAGDEILERIRTPAPESNE